MAFGAEKQQGGAGNGERFESRTLSITEGEERTTQSGNVYWRVKDSNNKYYSVWEEAVKINLEMAADKGETIVCAVKIENKGDKTFYSITGTGAAAEGMVQAGTQKASAAGKPGGKYSEYGKRMHPDDALRVTHLAHEDRTIQFIGLIIDDRPEGMSREQFAKGKFMPIMQFLAGITNMPKTATPDAPAPKVEESPATQQAASGGFGGPTAESVQGDDDDSMFF